MGVDDSLMAALEEVVPKDGWEDCVTAFTDCDIPSNEIYVNDCYPK